MVPGIVIWLKIDQDIVKLPFAVLTVQDQSLVGQEVVDYFYVNLSEYQGLELKDQEYSLDGSELVFGFTPVVLTPNDPGIVFDYTVGARTSVPIEGNLITFDSVNLLFTVKSSDQDLVGIYEFAIIVTSTDERWLGQPINGSFKLTVNKSSIQNEAQESISVSNHTKENEPPII